MTHEKTDSHYSPVPYLGKLSIGMVVACGLIVAGSLTAFPSASCTAIAETYARAINDFGGAAFLTVPFVVVGNEQRRQGGLFDRIVLGVATLIGVLAFIGAIGAGLHNLRASFDHCYIGSSAQIDERRHTRITLVDPFDVFTKNPTTPSWDQ